MSTHAMIRGLAVAWLASNVVSTSFALAAGADPDVVNLKAVVAVLAAQVADTKRESDAVKARLQAQIDAQNAALTALSATVGAKVPNLDRRIDGVRIFYKHGNNGSTSCTNYCASTDPSWGELGFCVGSIAEGNTTEVHQCSDVAARPVICVCGHLSD